MKDLIGLPPKHFAKVFPFHFVLNRDLEIVQTGESLAKVMPEMLLGESFDQHFKILRPHVNLSFDALLKKQKSLFLIESFVSNFQLKGQVIHLDEQNLIFFIGSLWITEMEKLKKYGIKLKDFAIHEPTKDFLFLLQSKNTVLGETKELASSLKQKKVELEATLTSLAEKNSHLNEMLQRLEATQEQLIQSEKMAALGQLIAGIAHEINTPLGAIRSSIENIAKFLESDLISLPQFFEDLNPSQRSLFLELISKSSESNWSSARERRQNKRQLTQALEEQELQDADDIAETLADLNIYKNYRDYLPLFNHQQGTHKLEMAYKVASLKKSSSTIQLATDRAAKVLFALKHYAHYDCSGSKKSTNIQDDIENILTLYQNQLKVGVEVVRHYSDVPPFLCFADELNQVWTNLIHNSLQAMDYNGTIFIDLEGDEEQIELRISDTGKGIPKEHLAKIFEPFFTTKPPGEGSGLGLDIVKKIVTKHEGSIHVISEPGNTQFIVRFPILQNSTEIHPREDKGGSNRWK